MSSQGTGHPSQNHGMKNTTDPLAKQSITESAGPVASDSLAAESYNDGEGFAENRNAAPSGTTGASSTFNTTDTSAASKLDSARDRTDRDDGFNSGAKYPDGLGGQPSFPGATTASGYSGGPTGGSYDSSSGSSGGSSGNDYNASTGADYGSSGNNTSSNVDAAPSYVADVYLGSNSKPKGSNLTEDDNLQGNRKTDYEIGGKDDPARAAVQGFANAAATGQKQGQTGIDGDNTYSNLGDDQA